MRTAAYFVASAARMASHSARRLASVLAACRSRGWQPRPVLGWSPGGRQGCQRMIEGQLADSTGGRRPAIWFSTCCCAPAEPALQKVRFWDPEHWRFRAEETRTVADQMTHEESRAIMRRIANDYDRLAKVAEEQLAAQEKRATGD